MTTEAHEPRDAKYLLSLTRAEFEQLHEWSATGGRSMASIVRLALFGPVVDGCRGPGGAQPTRTAGESVNGKPSANGNSRAKP